MIPYETNINERLQKSVVNTAIEMLNAPDDPYLRREITSYFRKIQRGRFYGGANIYTVFQIIEMVELNKPL